MYSDLHGHHVDGGGVLLPNTEHGPGGDVPTHGTGGKAKGQTYDIVYSYLTVPSFFLLTLNQFIGKIHG